MLLGPCLVHIGSLGEVDIEYKYAIIYYMFGIVIDRLFMN